MSDAALAVVRKVLEEDDDFRARVASVVDLGAMAAAGAEASALFLERPEGWEAALEALAAASEEAAATATAEQVDLARARRLQVAEEALARAKAELVALRDEVAALRTRSAADARARRTAESDAGRLRKRIAELERTVEDRATDGGAADDVAATAAAVAAAEDRAQRAEAAAREAQQEAAAARAALGSAVVPAPAPTAPLVDHEAVRTAVAGAVEAVRCLADALGQAAEALEPAVGAAWPPPPVAPARSSPRSGGRAGEPGGHAATRVPEALPPAVLDDEPAAAEHLLRLPRVLVLVDGYNVTITARGTASLPDQRRWLVDATAEAAARTGAEFLVVFDGSADEHGPGDGRRRRGVQVRFTAAGVEADDEVLELLVASPAERPVVVVSDDRRVRGGARRLGANVVGVDQLVAALRR
jgi:predicted RNA-binding protein with PIN domain